MAKKYSDEDFESLLSQYDYNFKRGDIVKGVVCGYESDGAIVDIGSKSTAFVPSYEVSSDKKARVEDVLEKGTEYEFLIVQECDENGKFNISYKKVHLAHTWSELEKVKEADETIAATIMQTVKGGLIVDVSGVQGFIPQGQLCARETICNPGEKIDVKILTLDKAQNNLILSNRKVYETNMAETRKSVFAQVEVGQVVKGEVVRITDFGAFVNIGADTVVVLHNKILGKPHTKENAFKMLKELSGATHSVVTSICGINTKTNRAALISTTSYVKFKELTDTMIHYYIDNYNPLDKAGSYGIQELPPNYIDKFEGSFENIVGLDSNAVKQILNQLEYTI